MECGCLFKARWDRSEKSTAGMGTVKSHNVDDDGIKADGEDAQEDARTEKKGWIKGLPLPTEAPLNYPQGSERGTR